jgi:N12 class adenine-specific DNA methylase
MSTTTVDLSGGLVPLEEKDDDLSAGLVPLGGPTRQEASAEIGRTDVKPKEQTYGVGAHLTIAPPVRPPAANVVSEQVERDRGANLALGPRETTPTVPEFGIKPVGVTIPVGGYPNATPEDLGGTPRFATDEEGRTRVKHVGPPEVRGQAMTTEEAAQKQAVGEALANPENIGNQIVPGFGSMAAAPISLAQGNVKDAALKGLSGAGEFSAMAIAPEAMELAASPEFGPAIKMAVALGGGQAGDAVIRKVGAERGWDPKDIELASQAVQWLPAGVYAGARLAGVRGVSGEVPQVDTAGTELPAQGGVVAPEAGTKFKGVTAFPDKEGRPRAAAGVMTTPDGQRSGVIRVGDTSIGINVPRSVAPAEASVEAPAPEVLPKEPVVPASVSPERVAPEVGAQAAAPPPEAPRGQREAGGGAAPPPVIESGLVPVSKSAPAEAPPHATDAALKMANRAVENFITDARAKGIPEAQIQAHAKQMIAELQPRVQAGVDRLSESEDELEAARRRPVAQTKPIALERYDEEGQSPDADKPHGAYFTLKQEGVESPHSDVGPVHTEAEVSGKNTLEVSPVKVQHARFKGATADSSGEVSAGVAALKHLSSASEFERLRKSSKAELVDELNNQFPGPDYSKYYDSYELLEALGAQKARAAGFDSIHLNDQASPKFSEYVALKPDAYSSKVGANRVPKESRASTQIAKAEQEKMGERITGHAESKAAIESGLVPNEEVKAQKPARFSVGDRVTYNGQEHEVAGANNGANGAPNRVRLKGVKVPVPAEKVTAIQKETNVPTERQEQPATPERNDGGAASPEIQAAKGEEDALRVGQTAPVLQREQEGNRPENSERIQPGVEGNEAAGTGTARAESRPPDVARKDEEVSLDKLKAERDKIFGEVQGYTKKFKTEKNPNIRKTLQQLADAGSARLRELRKQIDDATPLPGGFKKGESVYLDGKLVKVESAGSLISTPVFGGASSSNDYVEVRTQEGHIREVKPSELSREAPTEKPEAKVTPQVPPPKAVKEGDRVEWTSSSGEKLTGTVRSVDNSDKSLSVDTDQVRMIGRMPIGRIEHPKIANVRPIEDNSAKTVDNGATIKVAENESNAPTRAAGKAEKRPSVSEPARAGGNAPTEVPTERKPEAAQQGNTAVSPGRSDAGSVQHAERVPAQRDESEGSGGSSAPTHPATERAGGEPERTRAEGADGKPVKAPIPEPVEEAQQTTRELRNKNNFHISDEDAAKIGTGGEITKIKGNLDALETLKKIQAEGRETATPEEQETLAKYVDFGGLVGMLQNYWKPEYAKHYERFQKLLTSDEIQEIRETLPNTHYTSLQMVDWMWKAMQKMGFRGGRLLEPGMGIGNFIGRMPKPVSGKSEILGVERNPLTGAMAKLLYPDAKIVVKPFQQFMVPDGSLDAVIGNVPFQDFDVTDDPVYRALKLNLHNYFIVKSLDKLRPGGIAALITSRYTMDNSKGKGQRAREEMAKRADLIAAIRLPDKAFKGNAGTEVVADLLIFKKRAADDVPENMPDWTTLAPVVAKGEAPKYETHHGTRYIQNEARTKDKEFMVSKYWSDHPDHVLGNHSQEGTMYGPGQYTVKAPEDFTDALNKAMEFIPEKIFGKAKPSATVQQAPSTLQPEELEFAPEDVKPGSYFRDKNGRIKVKESGIGKELPKELDTFAARNQIGHAIDLRDQLNRTIQAQLTSSDDAPMKEEQKKLEKLYDQYRDRYGSLHGPKLNKLFGDDPEYPKILALESLDPETKNISKADIFTKRVLAPYDPLRELPNDPKSAMLKVMADRGYLDTKLMADLLGKDEPQVVENLKKEGLIYQDPLNGKYATADEYLSGNVREKLKTAEQAADTDPKFKPNVEALKKAQPEPLTIHEIQPGLGQTWIPTSIYESFVAKLLEMRGTNSVNISRDAAGKWLVQVKSAPVSTWDGGGIQAHKLVQFGLNQQQPTVWINHSDGTRTLDGPATTAARDKLTAIKEEFRNVLRKAPENVVQKLETIYNDTFNGYKLREFSGEHLDFPGMAQEWQDMIRGYQKAMVWRILQEGRAGLFHAPGLGKTLTMIASGMEARRLKLSRKNMYAVPNHMIPQWRNDFKRMYPNSNVLAVTDDDFNATNRAKLMSRIATGDWDAVIIPHSQFDLLPMSPEWEGKTIKKRLDDYRRVLEDLDDKEDKRTIKQIEKAMDKLESRLNELNAKKKDQTIPYDQLGIDMLFVDEAHAYKSMAVPSRMGNIGGLSNSASQRALAMEMKADFMRDTHHGRGLVFGTGTPITNTVGELYVMTKYLAPEMLEAAGIRSFDDWAANFATAITQWVYSPDGVTFKPKTTLSEYVNVPELSTMFRRFAEYLSKEDAKRLSNLKEPKVDRQDVMVKITPVQEPLLWQIAERGQHLIENPPKTREERQADNWLKLSSDARKISLDPRLYDSDLPDDPDSKVNDAVKKIKQVLDETNAEKGTVIVFSDFFQHNNPSTGKADFNLFDDMRKKLVKAGVPKNQIALIHDAGDDKEAKESIFSQMRQGKIRVLMGSTDKMGIGTNVQDRLKALAHLDQPWRPDQVEQREARAVRSGNNWDRVKVMRFIAEPREGKVMRWDKKQGKEVGMSRPVAYDLQMYQQLERKANFQEQFLTGQFKGRTMEDTGGDVKLNSEMFAIGKAASTGNPDAIRKLKLEHELRTQQMLQRNFQVQRSKYLRQIDYDDYHVQLQTKKLELLKRDVASWEKTTKGEEGGAPIEIGDQVLDTKDKRQAYFDKNPNLLDLVGKKIKIGGIDTELTADETTRMVGDKPTRVARFEYRLAGETHYVPMDDKGQSHPVSFLSSFASRARGLNNEAARVQADIDKKTQDLQTLRKEVKEASPYEAKVSAMEKEMEEINQRLGLNKPAEVDEGAIQEGAEEESPEKPKKTGTGGVTLRSGIDPTQFKELFPNVVEKMKDFFSDKQSAADEQKSMMRETRGEMDRKVAQAFEKLKMQHKTWSLRSRQQSLDFINAVENGDISNLPKDQWALAQTFRDSFDEMKGELQKLKPEILQHYIENYFPHIWDRQSRARSIIRQVMAGKRPFAGKGSFLKQRTIPTTQDGIDMGLKPVSWNPVDLFMLKYKEMAQFLMAHQTLDAMKEAGTAQYVKIGDKPPEGWQQLDDRIGTVYRRAQILDEDKLAKIEGDVPKEEIPGYTGTVLAGRYYAPADAARAFNNFVSRGFAGRSQLYDAAAWVNNNLNALQLGISAFHATTTTVNATTSDIALGIQQLSQGKFLEGVKNIAEGVTVAPSLINTLRNGSKLMKEYLEPGSYAKFAKEADAVATAGGRHKQNVVEIKPFDRMMSDFREGSIAAGLTHIPSTILDATIRPVMGWYVPRMKMGAFYEMAHNILETAAKEGWDHEKTRARVQKAWNSIDDRFGQLIYDNLFWHKAFRDSLMLATRSVGWNFGTIREIGGAVPDILREAGKGFVGEKPEVTDRMAHAFALAAFSALLGGVLTYLWTGKAPNQWKDYYYPLREDGTRVSIPGYMKDVFAYADHPGRTLLNKMGPLLSMTSEAIQNRDFYGTEIRHKDDSPIKQFLQVAKWAGSTALPFSVSGSKKLVEKEGEDTGTVASTVKGMLRHPGDVALGQFGFQPAPAHIQNSPALNLAREYAADNRPPGTKTKEQASRTHAMHQIEDMYRRGQVNQDAIKSYVEAGDVSERDVSRARLIGHVDPLVLATRSLSIEQALNVFDKADDKEKTALRPLIQHKFQNAQPADKARVRNSYFKVMFPIRPKSGTTQAEANF